MPTDFFKTNNNSLSRFVDAQNGRGGVISFKQALQEMKHGHKQTHWIWYILPQFLGHGSSANAVTYAIQDINEAYAYLKDDALLHNYAQITQEIAKKLQHTDANVLMGSAIDVKKLKSSITLFGFIAQELAKQPGAKQQAYRALAQSCQEIGSKIGFCHDTQNILNNTNTKQVKHSQHQVYTQPKPNQVNLAHCRRKYLGELNQYISMRQGERLYHYNFLGLAAALWYIVDQIGGGQYRKSKSRDVKLEAARKFREIVNTGSAEGVEFKPEELAALKEGRLCEIVRQCHGLDWVLKAAQSNEHSLKPRVF